MSSRVCSDSDKACHVEFTDKFAAKMAFRKSLGTPKHIQLPELKVFLDRSIQLHHSYVEYCSFSDVPIRRIEDLEKHLEMPGVFTIQDGMVQT